MIVIAYNIKYQNTSQESVENLPTEYALELNEEIYNPDKDLASLISKQVGCSVESLNYKIVER